MVQTKTAAPATGGTHNLRSPCSAESLPLDSLATGHGRAEVSRGSTTLRDKPTPYTHADHWQRGIAEAQHGRMVSRKHVQIRKGPFLYCGQILEAYTVPNGPDCWTVLTFAPEANRFTVPCTRVWECGGSDCTCAAEGVGAAGHASACPSEAGAAQRPEGFTCL